MASPASGAPTIPISLPSNPQPPPPPPPQVMAFRAFLSLLTDSVRNSLALRRPWYELLDRTSFSRPDSLSDAATRIRKNATYFKINYLILLSSGVAISLLSHPFSLLLLLLLLSAWLFIYVFRPSDSPFVIFNRQFSSRETLTGLVVFSVVVIFLTSVGSLIIYALMVGLTIVAAHGALLIPEDLFLDDPDLGNSSSGFLSFLGNAGPAVVSRV